MMGDHNRSYVPLWGGISSMFGTTWQLYTHTLTGIRSAGWFYRALELGNNPAPLRQRLITTGLSTAGVPLSDLPEEAELPGLDTAGVEDVFETIERPRPPESRPPPAMTWDFSWNPLRFIMRSVLLPVVGAVDIAVQRALPVVYTVVSLVYQSLPLTNITRISRFVRILTKSKEYVFTPGPQKDQRVTCSYCGEESIVLERRAVNKIKRATDHRCEHCYLDNWNRKYTSKRTPPDFVFDTADVGKNGPIHFRGSVPIYTATENLRGRMADLFSIANMSPCSHPIGDHSGIQPTFHVPSPTVDGLFELPPEHVWRKENRCNGIRCVYCFPNSLHSWDPALVRGIRNFNVEQLIRMIDDEHLDNIWVVLGWFNQLIAHMRHNLTSGRRYVLTSCTRDRIDKFRLVEHPYHVVVVDSDETSSRLLSKFPKLREDSSFVYRLPMVGGPVSYAGWRLIIAAICPVDCEFLILNQSVSYYEPLGARILSDLAINWSSVAIGHVYPFYMGTAFIKGRTSLLGALDWAYLFYAGGFMYGWDELVPALWERPTVVLISDPGLPPIMAPLVNARLPPFTPVNFYLVDSAGKFRGAYVADFTRENIFLMKQLGAGYVDQGRVTLAHAFTDPRPISETTIVPDILIVQWDQISPDSPRFAPSSAAGENILSEISHTHGGILFFTFGSRGDRSPVLANARYIAKLGAKVTVIHLNDEEEGRKLANMSGDLEMWKAGLFLRAREVLAGYASMTIIAPHQLFFIGGVSYTLAPPDDIIYPFVSSNNVVLAVCYSLLGALFAPDLRIGAFATSHTLPTSIDGENFVQPVLNRGKPGSIGAWWGGDGIAPKGWEHIPLIPPGNHVETFPNYETIVLKGTVGSVTLAVMSGSRPVVVGNNGLDRLYRNPYDAGAGFVPGQDPDRIFLALGKLNSAYYGIWARAHWYNLRELWAWFGPESIGLAVFRGLMLYLYLSRLQKASFLSTTPLTTLILMLDGRSTVPLKTFLLYIAAAKVADTMLKILSKNYLWLATKFLGLNSRMMSSAIAFWVAQTRGWFSGLLVAQATNLLEPAVYWFVTWVPITLGANPDQPLPPNDEYGVVEFKLIWRVIPVLHVALVFPFAGKRLEGGVDEFGLYRASLHPGVFHSPFVFPTRIRLSDILIAVKNARALPYGATWHCYSVLWDCIGHRNARLGVAAVPFLFTIGASAVLSSATALALSVFYTIATAVPALGGLSTRDHSLLSLISDAIHNTVDMVEAARGDYSHLVNVWFARFTFLAPLPTWLYI